MDLVQLVIGETVKRHCRQFVDYVQAGRYLEQFVNGEMGLVLSWALL
jgi:hypothetical protein